MRVPLDTNVVLDVLLMRAVWQADAEAILKAARESRLLVAFTSLSVANVFYVARRHVGFTRAKLIVHECLQAFEILSVDRAALLAAEELPGSDFEDNIQIAAATAAGVDAIVTRDPAGFSGSSIAVLTPRQLLEQLGGGQTSGNPGV